MCFESDLSDMIVYRHYMTLNPRLMVASSEQMINGYITMLSR